MQMSFKSAAVSALVACLSLAGCGGADQPSASKVVGAVSAEAAVSSVSLKDSSVPPAERTSATDSDGAFAFDVDGLTPPFLLSAVDANGNALSALALAAGRTDIDAVTTAALSLARGEREEGDRSDRYESVLRALRTVLQPLFDHYGVRFGEDWDESRAFRTMLREVSFTISNGQLVVANRATGGVIYSAPLGDLASGTLHPENIPGGTAQPPPPASPCTSFAYSAWSACANGTQSRTVVSASPAGCTGGSPVLTQACSSTPPPAPTCTAFTYSAWGACQSNGTQTRTVVSSSPAGCTGGNPVLSQACTFVPPTPAPDGAALYAASCAGCHGALASSNLKGKAISVSLIKSRGMTQGLTDAQLQAIVTAVGP